MPGSCRVRPGKRTLALGMSLVGGESLPAASAVASPVLRVSGRLKSPSPVAESCAARSTSIAPSLRRGSGASGKALGAAGVGLRRRRTRGRSRRARRDPRIPHRPPARSDGDRWPVRPRWRAAHEDGSPGPGRSDQAVASQPGRGHVDEPCQRAVAARTPGAAAATDHVPPRVRRPHGPATADRCPQILGNPLAADQVMPGGVKAVRTESQGTFPQSPQPPRDRYVIVPARGRRPAESRSSARPASGGDGREKRRREQGDGHGRDEWRRGCTAVTNCRHRRGRLLRRPSRRPSPRRTRRRTTIRSTSCRKTSRSGAGSHMTWRSRRTDER